MAVAFKPGQKFRFSDSEKIYTFISINFHNGDPVIVYEDGSGSVHKANGYDLSDLIRV